MNFKLLIVCSLLMLSLGACVSSQQLEQLSEEQFQQMRSELPISKNARDRAYVTCVSKAIIAELPPPYSGYKWDIEVFDNDAINAFAMPGGKIGVFDGIFKAAVNQNQLAAVIGHEVAHVTLDHSLDRANREMATKGTIAIGSSVLGAPAGVADAVALGADLGLLRPYGRSQESESDLVGLRFMSSAGFDPNAAVDLWRNMAKESGEAPPEWMSTHPSSNTRINALEGDLVQVMPIYNKARQSGKRPNCSR